MSDSKFLFSQLTDFIPKRIFDSIVSKYDGDKRARHFTSWNQMLCMIFGQVSASESLRDLTSVINAHQKKSYHLGFGKSISKTNLARFNEKRNYKIFKDFMLHMIKLAQSKIVADDFQFKDKIYAFDSTTIDLCLTTFGWAKYKSTKSGVKVHTLFDTQTKLPVFINITEGQVNDVKMMDSIKYESEAYYIFDRAYIDFGRLYKIETHDAFFVTRAKSNINYRVINYVNEISLESGILKHEIIKLKGFYQKKSYPKELRKILYFDKETENYYEFLTNNFELSSVEIALLYKQRWGVEIFFKWIKGHLRILKFWGRSENAVRIQIYCAVITYCLVAIAKCELKLSKSIYEIIRILSPSLLDKTPIYQLLADSDENDPNTTPPKQLCFKGI